MTFDRNKSLELMRKIELFLHLLLIWNLQSTKPLSLLVISIQNWREVTDNIAACFYNFSVMSDILMAFMWWLLKISFLFFFFFFPSSNILIVQYVVLNQNSSKSGMDLNCCYAVWFSIQTRFKSIPMSQNANGYTA